ncbi:hypothetical protein PSI19_16240 [Xenorhabdus khoisanae]|uniref:hypothetical protein n=1 Tax=Xenorhabdus TaxID=626 RepID=UPI0023588117|nr:hypothetical protein [Xenorhabdus khoisanae]MDC9615387.1 hypothetical protein [Xenorhabdus khoisanae]
MNGTKKYYKLGELTDLAAKRGYMLKFNSARQVFELKDKEHHNNWCWIVRPSNGVRVGQVRECWMSEWDEIIDFNIDRLKKNAENFSTMI